MSDENGLRLNVDSPEPVTTVESPLTWLRRRFCCPNPFYLISVWFVLRGTSQWFHADSGVSFSPWPLFWLTAGYTLLLAVTGFVVIRFGQVWDDARSILLMILLLFVQLSSIFDETLLRDPATGRLILCACWAFSAVLFEALLRGLRIRLPWLFRLPYHAFIALLFFYPLSLVSTGDRLTTETILWRIVLFPTVAALIALFLIPAIRRGRDYIRHNGTPWLWPWYPWSLFVFLGLCIGFRAYALSQSFDPALNESAEAAMKYATAFGVYFLIPLILAIGLLILEIGLVEKCKIVIDFALLVPIFCLFLSFPAAYPSASYQTFLRLVTREIGSPIWITVLASVAFYGIAAFRRVDSSEPLLVAALLLLIRVGPQTDGYYTLTVPQWWPLLAISAIELCVGLWNRSSRSLFISACFSIAGFDIFANATAPAGSLVRLATASVLSVGSILLIGALYRDRFARILRLIGAPLLVLATIMICILIDRGSIKAPLWFGPLFVIALSLTAFIYARITAMPIYRLSSLFCAISGTIGFTEMGVAYLVRESGWHGATSFVTGLCCLALAAFISSWKAGWLRNVPRWFQSLLIVQ